MEYNTEFISTSQSLVYLSHKISNREQKEHIRNGFKELLLFSTESEK